MLASQLGCGAVSQRGGCVSSPQPTSVADVASANRPAARASIVSDSGVRDESGRDIFFDIQQTACLLSVIQCSQDCSVGIICSLTASKTCLPDGTWSVCREVVGVQLDLPGFQCRNMLHGCLPADSSEPSGELFVGHCSKQFKCGRAPSLL
jgi:hypothetical protein